METSKSTNTKVTKLSEEQMDELISGQFRFIGKDYIEAKKDPNWRNNHQLNTKEYSDWLDWAVNLLISKYKMEEKNAQIQLSWMELKFGLDVK